jgi:hypothetical protein
MVLGKDIQDLPIVQDLLGEAGKALSDLTTAALVLIPLSGTGSRRLDVFYPGALQVLQPGFLRRISR